MRNLLLKAFLGVAVTSMALFGADNSIGTWKRNIAKSKSTPVVANPITDLMITNEAAPGGAKVTVTGKRKDGAEISSKYTVKYDGKEVAVEGAPWDTTAVKQVDANTFTFESKKTGGKYHSTGRSVISKDGKTMTTTVKGTNDEGKPLSGKYVYDKQ